METFISDQPAPAHLREARWAVQAVLRGDDLDIYNMAVLVDVLGQLIELHPLQLPNPDRDAPQGLVAGVTRAVESLGAAANGAETPREQLKIALMQRQLRDVLDSHEHTKTDP